jgi:hypothetical protein
VLAGGWPAHHVLSSVVAFANFDAVRRLDDDALRSLLRSGEPTERVWAAWEVGLRRQAAHPEIVGHFVGEPTPGVRRAMLVVIAGHGEVDVLVAIARHDPAPEVRAAAMRLIVRFVLQGAIDRSIVADAFPNEVPEVRIAIVETVPADAPDDLRGLVLAALASHVSDEQLAGFDGAFRIGLPHAAMAWLETTTGALAIAAWARFGESDPAAITAALAEAGPAVRSRAFALLTPIARLVGVEGIPRDFHSLRDRPDLDRAPAELLATAVIHGCPFDFVDRLVARISAGYVPSPALLGRLAVYVVGRIDEVERGRPLPDEQPRWRWAPGRVHRSYVALRDAIQRVR